MSCSDLTGIVLKTSKDHSTASSLSSQTFGTSPALRLLRIARNSQKILTSLISCSFSKGKDDLQLSLNNNLQKTRAIQNRLYEANKEWKKHYGNAKKSKQSESKQSDANKEWKKHYGNAKKTPKALAANEQWEKHYCNAKKSLDTSDSSWGGLEV